MPWKKLIITFLVLLTAGWMLFDGSRALIVGDYVMETDGEYAGQLGPWANLMRGLGVDPRSTGMKIVFVVYGSLALASLWCYWAGYKWAASALMIVCFLGLWYLPFGTIANLVVLFLMMIRRRKHAAAAAS